uniref:tRNA (guanine-N(7)-)-methyltransferase non-catalytic subunit n=1 Tax=Phallusia mammillata TaxID=59560 RepID=A0A6F9DPY5_9ASCI|nr:pleiotropic regulator 1 [Phallusia mammillata]
MAIIKSSPQFLVVALKQSLHVLAKNTGNFFTYTREYKSNIKENEQQLDSAAFSPNYKYFAALYSDKTLVVWIVKNGDEGFEQHLVIDVCRRSTSIAFDIDDRCLYVADKSGDLYAYDMEKALISDEIEPVLGHVSMLLDVAVTEKYLITADRDEKIRVSHKKMPYLIESFCLGHSEFICQLCCLNEDLILSLSGDGSAKLWDFKQGNVLQDLVIVSKQEKTENDEKSNEYRFVPSLVAYNSTLNLLAIACNAASKIGMYKFADNALEKMYDIEIPDNGSLLSMSFDNSTASLYLLNSCSTNLNVLKYKCSSSSYALESAEDIISLNERIAQDSFTVKTYEQLFKPPMNGIKKYVDFYKKKHEGKLFCKPNPKKSKVTG